MITPDNDNILVELRDEYTHIATTEKKYDTRTKGICVKAPEKFERWLHKVVYFKSYEDDTVIEENGKRYALIEAKFVKGYTDAE